MTFGEKLFRLRKEKGLSQEALAEQVKTTRQAVSQQVGKHSGISGSGEAAAAVRCF